MEGGKDLGQSEKQDRRKKLNQRIVAEEPNPASAERGALQESRQPPSAWAPLGEPTGSPPECCRELVHFGSEHRVVPEPPIEGMVILLKAVSPGTFLISLLLRTDVGQVNRPLAPHCPLLTPLTGNSNPSPRGPGHSAVLQRQESPSDLQTDRQTDRPPDPGT